MDVVFFCYGNPELWLDRRERSWELVGKCLGGHQAGLLLITALKRES